MIFKAASPALPHLRVHLEKYYVDVIGADGSGLIGYAARLGGLAATVAATLRWEGNPGRAPEARHTLRGQLPVAGDARVTWRCPALALAGTWDAPAPAPAEQLLWGDARGGVFWQVLAAPARVTLHAGDRTVVGWGYAERLRLNLPPWRLPIDGLRWGRFVAPAHCAVWIEWAHATPRCWLWHNGAAGARPTVTESGVGWTDGRVAFGALRPLRTGRLADTVFARWPGLRRWLPARVQAFHETKWCAPATLTAADGTVTAGWVIHEHVRLK